MLNHCLRVMLHSIGAVLFMVIFSSALSLLPAAWQEGKLAQLFTFNEAGAYTISGTAYSDAGVTNVGSGSTVRMISGGADVGSAVTNASGVYSISVTLSAGTPFLVYLDGGSIDATTVSLASGAALSGIDLYQNHAIMRSDNGGSLTNANMNTALGGYSDNEIHYTVAAGAVTIDPTSQLYIATGHSYTPGGNVTTDRMDNKGTFVGGNFTLAITHNMLISGGSFTAPSASGSFTVGESFTVTAGTYTHNSGTVTFNTDGGNLSTINTGSAVFNNVNIVKVNNDIDVTGTMNIGGNLTLTSADNLGGGTYAVGGNISTADVGILGDSAITLNGTGAQTITSSGGGVFPGGTFTINKASGTASLASDISLNVAGQDLTITSGTLDLAGYNLTVNDVLTNAAAGTLKLKGNETVSYGTLTFNTGSTVLYYGTAGPYTVKNWSYKNLTFNGAATTFNLGAALNVAENLTITAGTLDVTATNYAVNVTGNFSNSGTFTARSGTVTLNGTNQAITGSTTFYRLTKSVTSAATLTFAAGSTTTVSNLLTLTGAASNLLSLRSSSDGSYWLLHANGTKSFNYLDVKDSDASGSAIAQPFSPANSADSGHNIGWFSAVTLTVSKSSAIISDPSNGTTNPKHIPGAVVEYTITVANTGGTSPDVNTVYITDPLDSGTLSYYVTGGITFTDGATSSALALGTITYSSTAAPGPYVYTYTPVADGNGYDGTVTSIKATTTGTFAFGGAPAPSFTLKFRAKVK